MDSMRLHWRHAAEGFAPPNQRYRVAKKCHDDGLRLPFGVDVPTRRIFQFLRARDSARDSKSELLVLNNYADLVTAFLLRRRKYSSLRGVIEAYLVAEADSVSIAARSGFSAQAIKSYGEAFYDVRQILKSPIRTLHELIGSFHDRNEFDWDISRLYKWVSYKLGTRGLDEMLGVNDRSNRQLGNLTDLVAEQSRSILRLKQLRTMSQMNATDPKHRELLVKLWVQEQTRQEKEGALLNPFEQHLEAFLKDIPWAVGSDAELIHGGTPLGKYDDGAAELRDDEVLRVAAGEAIDPDLPVKIPPPRKRTPQKIGGDTLANQVNAAPFSAPTNSNGNRGK